MAFVLATGLAPIIVTTTCNEVAALGACLPPIWLAGEQCSFMQAVFVCLQTPNFKTHSSSPFFFSLITYHVHDYVKITA